MESLSDMFTQGTQRLIHDSHYVAYVFKKTEKICNAVYFITAHTPDAPQGHQPLPDIVREVESSALALLGHVQATLSRTRDELPMIAPTLSIAILDLSAKLGILAATGRMSRSHLSVFTEELDTLERAIYFHEPDRAHATAVRTPLRSTPRAAPKRDRAVSKAVNTPAAPSLPVPSAPSEHNGQNSSSSRVSVIKDILSKVPSASIKDIARWFPDVSEKTVQREVNGLIDAGTVRKEGEKRWSRYSLISS